MSEWFVKAEGETDSGHGCLPSKRPIKEHLRNGIVNLDKPSGPTSTTVSDWVKKILNANKAGHCGTLDPKVTGVLVVPIDNATKVIPTLLPSPKTYVGTARFHKDLPLKDIQSLFRQFTGTIYQKPPLRSAVVRKLRKRTIYSSEIIEKSGQDVLFQVKCEAGTYIRKLIHDIGTISCGAHMSELRRTAAASFDESTLVTLQQLSEAQYLFKAKGDDSLLRKYIQPVETAVKSTPKIVVQDSTVESLCHGAVLNVPGISKFQEFKIGERVAILTLKGELIALAESMIDSAKLNKASKGAAAKISRVVMEPGTYPRWKKDD